ncbi:hypothetical protein EVAR_61752_1 [Eumeta japonica]|uniref:Uncharacterized protein n=1 Tax=Eumeta variegata TaxID=151549 RepID=A0A4C1YLH9_EUMVA|nr:hypothetical protein EVAR_61752_1 [Eumeta japonica]
MLSQIAPTYPRAARHVRERDERVMRVVNRVRMGRPATDSLDNADALCGQGSNDGVDGFERTHSVTKR